MPEYSHEIVTGIDIGGTHVRVAAVNAAGSLLAARQADLEPERGAVYGLQLISDLIREVVRDAGSTRLAGIGIGATGPVDRAQGSIQNPYTLPTWENVPVVSELERAFAVPVVLENDADAAALGEYWQGAGQGVERLYAVTVGTGIGAAFLLRGEIYRGLNGSHPEAGHQLVDPAGPLCYCGVRGCWESLASGTAIAQAARNQAAGSGSLLLDLAGRDPLAITAEMVAQAARAKDPLAVHILDNAIAYFTRGLLNVVAFLVPDVIVLSGGVMRSLDLYQPAIQQALDSYNVMSPAKQVQVLPAQLGTQAGLVGAAYAIWKNLGQV